MIWDLMDEWTQGSELKYRSHGCKNISGNTNTIQEDLNSNKVWPTWLEQGSEKYKLEE